MHEPTITTAKPAKPMKTVPKEILHSYEEFKAKIDPEKPIHHRAFRQIFGEVYCRLVFRIYALDKNSGGIVIFEAHSMCTTLDFEEQENAYRKLVEKYAKPLGSTEGAWIP